MTKRQKSRREILTENKNALDFYAASVDKRHNFTVPIPPKRAPRTKQPGKLSEYQEQGLVIDWWWHAHATYGLPVFALSRTRASRGSSFNTWLWQFMQVEADGTLEYQDFST